MQIEPILQENKNRFVLFPIEHKEIWELYKKAEQGFWCIDSISFDDDVSDYKNLTEQERVFIKFIITAFQLRANSDINNLTNNFLGEVQYAEARCFYGCQTTMLNNHSEVYSLLSTTYLDNNYSLLDKQLNYFKTKSEWIVKNFVNEPSFSKRLVSYMAIQRIFHSHLFIGIARFKSKRLMKILYMLIDFIYAEENLFIDFSLTIYCQLKNKLSEKESIQILHEAVEIENELTKNLMPFYDSVGIKESTLIKLSKYHYDTITKSILGQPDDQPNPISQLVWKRHFIKIDPDKKQSVGFGEIAFDADF